MDIIKVFGTNVRKYRQALGLSQEAFADKCGLHRTYISSIECFRRSISLENIQRIADALDIEPYGNRQYVLHPSDHELLFQENAKAVRIQLNSTEKEQILSAQSYRCNICGALLKPTNQINPHTFAKDRVRIEFDHRIPIDHGGSNNTENIQALCHYCNKCKRQMCFVCHLRTCSPNCALVYPEHENFVLATDENILDRITKR